MHGVTWPIKIHFHLAGRVFHRFIKKVSDPDISSVVNKNINFPHVFFRLCYQLIYPFFIRDITLVGMDSATHGIKLFFCLYHGFLIQVPDGDLNTLFDQSSAGAKPDPHCPASNNCLFTFQSCHVELLLYKYSYLLQLHIYNLFVLFDKPLYGFSGELFISCLICQKKEFFDQHQSNTSAILTAALVARAIMVTCGFTPRLVGTELPSTTKRPGTL